MFSNNNENLKGLSLQVEFRSQKKKTAKKCMTHKIAKVNQLGKRKMLDKMNNKIE